MRYPGTRTTDDVATLAGVTFADPYRWLSEESAEVSRWQDEQNALADAYVRDWPHFDALRERVERFSTPRFPSFPVPLGDRWARVERGRGVVIGAEPFGDGPVLYDPSARAAGRPPFVSWLSPSPDGTVLALGVCADGSERNTILLVDVATGDLLPDPPEQELMDNWTGGAHWLPDSSGFFFTGVEGRSTDLVQHVWLYRTGPARTTRVDVPWAPGQDYRVVYASGDGRYAVAVQGMQTPVPVAVARLGGSGEPVWRPFVTGEVGSLYGHLVDDAWIAVSDHGAPRGRVVRIPLDCPDPSDPSSWTEVVPESGAALRAVTPVGDRLYVLGLVDTYSEVRVFGASGEPLGTVPLPGRGAVLDMPFPMINLFTPGRPGEYLFAFTTLTTSPGYYRHRPGEARAQILRAPDRSLPDAVVEDRWATSADGTRIPYHVVRNNDVPPGRPLPALLFAYGGFNSPLHPAFPGPMATFVEAGGVFVHAHLRGGGEFGREWWEGGRQGAKANCYDDLFAVAADLTDTGVTVPGLLGVVGGSNGGLLAGAAAVRRPDLFAVAVPRVPILDLVGACEDGYGRSQINHEYARVDDPDEVRRLATLSPYHLVGEGVEYPAVYLDAGATDPRCPPWHARKFGARLQAAGAGENPVLIRVWRDAGHGWATGAETAVLGHTGWLAFTMKRLGLTPGGTDTPAVAGG